MAGPPTVRDEDASDIEAIRSVHLRAFPTSGEATLVDRLRDANRLAVSLVAVVDHEVVGHAALSPVTIGGKPFGLGLAPVAVVPQHQNRGIGGQLVQHALSNCRNIRVDSVVVLGDPHHYARFGFVSAGSYGLKDEYDGGDAFQIVFLVGESLARNGIVQYAPEFALLE